MSINHTSRDKFTFSFFLKNHLADVSKQPAKFSLLDFGLKCKGLVFWLSVRYSICDWLSLYDPRKSEKSSALQTSKC